MDKQTINQRRIARRLGLQALYQWMISGQELTDIDAQFRAANDVEKIDIDYFCELLYKIPSQVTEIDQELEKHLDRKIEELNPIELIIMRIGCYEFMHRLDVPYRVVIGEAIKLAREFGAEEGHKYVNGVLDKIAHEYRTAEIKQ